MMWTCTRCNSVVVGQRAEHCGVCCQTFTGTTAGDMHRVGRHGILDGPDRRRCLSPTEMAEKGMDQDSLGRWGTGRAYTGPTPGNPAESLSNRARSVSQPEPQQTTHPRGFKARRITRRDPMPHTMTSRVSTTMAETATSTSKFVRLDDDVLSCAWCGITLEPGAEAVTEAYIHPAGLGPRPSIHEPFGICHDCQPWADLADELASRNDLRHLGPAGAERLARAIVSACCVLNTDPPNVGCTPAEMRTWARVFSEIPAPTWARWIGAHYVVATATRHRWAHLDEEVLASLRAAMARVLAERLALTRPPVRVAPPRVLTISGETAWPGRCLVCGTDHIDMPAVQVLDLGGSTATARKIWTRHTLSTGRGPERLAGYCCPRCEEAIRAAGNVIGPTAYDVALTAHLGLRTGTVAAGMYFVRAVPAWQTRRHLDGTPWSHYRRAELDDLRGEILPDLGQPDIIDEEI